MFKVLFYILRVIKKRTENILLSDRFQLIYLIRENTLMIINYIYSFNK